MLMVVTARSSQQARCNIDDDSVDVLGCSSP